MSSKQLMADGLINAITGAGTARDPRTAGTYQLVAPMDRSTMAAAWQGSGLLRKVIKAPADDMVREWRIWKAEAKEVAALEAAERKLGIRQKVRTAEVLRGRGGAIMVLGLPGDLAQPAPSTIAKGALTFVNVLSRWQVSFSKRIADSNDPLFGEPELWQVPGVNGANVDVHPSRVIAFRGDIAGALADLSLSLNGDDAYWGDSVASQVHEAVRDFDTVRGAFATLVSKASRLRIGIPDLMEILREDGGEARLMTRLNALVQGESLLNATLYDAGNGEQNPGEKLDDATYTFTGAKDMLMAYSDFVCAVSDIPATRLFGRAPEGLNSSGDGQQTDWNKMVRGRQELDLQPCLDRLDEYLIQHALGKPNTDGSIWWSWAPLDTPSAKEEATRFKTDMEAINILQQTGTIPEPAFTKAVQSKMIEDGHLPGLEAALEEMPEEERWGIDQPDEEEGDTPPADIPLDDPRLLAANDARPRTLYVHRPLLNGAEVLAWAQEQGIPNLMRASELHVTLAYSRQALDWFAVEDMWGDEEELIIKGGPRLIERLGDRGEAVVLLFASSQLSWRHEMIKRAGATWDHEHFQPHVTLSWDAPGLDVESLEPYRGELRFGREVWEELNPDWKADLAGS